MPADPIAEVMRKVGEEILADLQRTVGKGYPPASAPGQPPHRRTGELQNSFTVRLEGEGSADVVMYIESTADHSAYLEYGTSRMAARPFLAPLRKKWTPIIHRRLAAAAARPGFIRRLAGAIAGAARSLFGR